MKAVDLQAEWDLTTVKCLIGEADDFIKAIKHHCWCDKMKDCIDLGPHSLLNVTTFKRMISVRRDRRYLEKEWSR